MPGLSVCTYDVWRKLALWRVFLRIRRLPLVDSKYMYKCIYVYIVTTIIFVTQYPNLSIPSAFLDKNILFTEVMFRYEVKR